MEFQGYAIAGVVVLLLAYVAPYLYRRRVVLAEARIDERYAEDLRILAVKQKKDSSAAYGENGDHGTVFYRRPEVMMSNAEDSHAPAQLQAPTKASTHSSRPRTASAAGRPSASNKVSSSGRSSAANEVRTLAKDKARRNARIAKRGALQKRGLLGGAAVGVLAIVAWVLALAATLPVLVAAIATGLVGAYFIGFSYLVGEINKANAADTEAIADINVRLAGGRKGSVRASSASRKPSRPGVRSRASEEPVDTAQHDEAQAQHDEAPEQIGVAVAEAPEAPARAEGSGLTMSMSPEVIADGEVVAGRERSPLPTSAPAGEASNRRVDSVAEDGPAASPSIPSYTLKPRVIERRVVAPYQAPEEPTAAVPYRPKDVGETLDGAENAVAKKAADEASTAGGAEGLAGGSVLDRLLDRRRA